MIEFRCPKCSQDLVAKDNQVGEVSRCPHCKETITITATPVSTEEGLEEGDELTAAEPPKSLDGAMLDLSTRQRLAQERAEAMRQEWDFAESLGFRAKAEPDGGRRHAWPLDILLYPVGLPGLLNLLWIAGFLLLTRHGESLGLYLGYRIHMARFVTGLYAYWYLAECVENTIQGGTRAPKAVNDVADPGEIWSRLMHLGATCLLCLFPASLYYISTGRIDAPFWVCVAWAVLSFPMALLAVLVHDSLRALNPLLLLRSMARVWSPYLLLELIVAVSAALVWIVCVDTHGPTPLTWLGAIEATAIGYGIIILAHLLGLFYRRYEEKLDWDI